MVRKVEFKTVQGSAPTISVRCGQSNKHSKAIFPKHCAEFGSFLSLMCTLRSIGFFEYNPIQRLITLKPFDHPTILSFL